MNKKPVKAAVLATVAGFGGAEKVVLSLIGNINNELYELIPIVFTRYTQAVNKFFKYIGRVNRQYHKVPLNNYKFKYVNPFSNIVEVYRLLKREKFDLIHTHGYRADVIGVILCKLTGLPIISTCHGFISNDRNLKIYNTLDRFSLRFFNKIITVSDPIKIDLIKSGIDESKIIVIQNAVEEKIEDEIFFYNRKEKRQLLNTKEDEFVLGYIGRLSEEKGIKYLIESSSMLNDLNIPVKVLIIGQGPQQKELEDLAKEKGIESKVIFTGFQWDVENWLPALDVFVLPSLTEGTPMSLLEAMAFGIPVVASAVGGVPQVIDSGKNGILVSPGKPGEIKDAVLNLYRNENFRTNISTAGQKYIAAKHNVEDWVRKIEGEYLNLLK
jgi:glycosyltransferase involved in cell wall biosynthesis